MPFSGTRLLPDPKSLHWNQFLPRLQGKMLEQVSCKLINVTWATQVPWRLFLPTHSLGVLGKSYDQPILLQLTTRSLQIPLKFTSCRAWAQSYKAQLFFKPTDLPTPEWSQWAGNTKGRNSLVGRHQLQTLPPKASFWVGRDVNRDLLEIIWGKIKVASQGSIDKPYVGNKEGHEGREFFNFTFTMC